MEHVEYVSTFGLDETAVEALLRAGRSGVIALSRDGEAYAVLLDYGGDRLLVRVAHHGDGDRLPFVEATETAALVVYGAPSPETSWSVVVRGPLRPLAASEQPDEAELNDRFPPLRLFGEAVAAVEPGVYELVMETVTGRAAPGAAIPDSSEA